MASEVKSTEDAGVRVRDFCLPFAGDYVHRGNGGVKSHGPHLAYRRRRRRRRIGLSHGSAVDEAGQMKKPTFIGGGKPGERHAVLGDDQIYCEWQGPRPLPDYPFRRQM